MFDKVVVKYLNGLKKLNYVFMGTRTPELDFENTNWLDNLAILADTVYLNEMNMRLQGINQ